jgi:hypothetical protein
MHPYKLTIAAEADRRRGDVKLVPVTIRCATSVVIVAVCGIALSGCRWSQTTWTANARSPDGLWLAEARTIENSGFGTGAILTVVSLKRTNVWEAPKEILSFWHDPYLASQSGATINLSMKWISPTHLEVTYRGHADLGFQVVKYANIAISVRDLSSETTNNSN